MSDLDDDYEPEDSSDFEGNDEENERPNRWHGPASTWRTFVQEETNTLTALQELQNRDLSVHLYDAFALKKRHDDGEKAGAPVSERDINAATGEEIAGDTWMPPKSWTAWPMSADKVPPYDLMKAQDREEEGEEEFTLRKTLDEMPSTALEEIISATILRLAKEKFESRSDAESEEETLTQTVENATEDDSDEMSESHSVTSSRASEAERMSIHETENIPGQSSNPTKVFRPVLSTDDDLSYELLRPSVRHVLEKLDATLTILHNAQESCLNYLSDSSSSSTANSRGASPAPSSMKRKRGRPRSIRSEQAPSDARPKSRAGRPKKTYDRLEGESDRDFAMRIARLKKKPLPFFQEAVADEPKSEASSLKEPKLHRSDDEVNAGAEDVAKRQRRNSNMRRRLGLRDWSEVVGAAALAGFSPSVIARTSQRCADLFGQSMNVHTLLESQPDYQDLDARFYDKTTRYAPGMSIPHPSLVEDEEDYSSHLVLERLNRSRQSSVAASVMSVSGNERGRSRSVSRTSGSGASRGRSHSRGSSLARNHFCHVHGCSRGVQGFPRRGNLVRHLRLVHGIASSTLPDDVDSEDEMYGAVHLDGFLKPIRMRKGWRGEDLSSNKRIISRGQRRGRGAARVSSESDSKPEFEHPEVGEDSDY